MKKMYQAFSDRHFCVLMLFLCFLNVLEAQSIFTNPITDSNPSAANPFTAGQTVNANITVSGIGRGTGISANAGSDRYNATGWATAAIDLNDYFQWTLTPNSSYEIDFVSLVYTGQASGTGPTTFALRSSVDNFASNIGAPTAAGTTISLAAAAFQNRTTAITFRLYGWGGSSAAGTYSVNSFTFNGTVNAVAVANPNLSINDVSTNEGNAGATNFNFTVSLSSPAGAGGVSFTIATADGTATAPSDYTSKSLSAQTIAAGQSTYTFTVAVNGDATVETNETFFVNLTSVTGATVTDGQGQGTILNDDTCPSITISVDENSGTAPNDGVICAGASVDLSTSAGGTYTWSTGETTASIDVAPSITTTYTVTVTNGLCVGSANAVITVNPVPTFTATPSNGICPATAPLVTLDVPAAAGYKYDISTGSSYTGSMTAGSGGTAIGTDPLQVFTFPTPPTVGGTQYTVRVINTATGCYSDQTFTIAGIPVPCDCATPAQVAFEQESLSTCGAVVAAINYTVANGPASLTTTGAGILSTNSLNNGISSFTYTPTIAEIGTTITITATIADPDGEGPCTNSTDIISIQVNQPVSVEAGTSQDICNNQTVNLTTIGASITGGATTGTWSSSGTGSFSGGTAFGSATAYIPSTADKAAGTVTLTLTSTDPAGACQAGVDTVVITVRSLNCATFPWSGR